MPITLSHFQMSLIFALLASIILGLVTKRTDKERLRYGIYCFGCFMAALFGIGWIMHFLHG